MSDRPFISHFSPQWTPPEYLEKILVQRGDLLAESVASVRESVLGGKQSHLLFIGPRGVGKTHLVSLIHYRLKRDESLEDRMRIAWLNEDETATSFLRLLIAMYRSLGEKHPEEFPSDTLSALLGKEPSVALEMLTRAFLKDLNGRRVVCIMENLDSLFRSLSVAEQRTWRAFLQNHPVITIVGTAQALFDGIADHDEPFFGFFATRHLQPLTAEDAQSLLEKIAELQGRTDLAEYLRTPKGRARVDAVRSLAGGNPRLYLIFSDLLVDAAALDDLVRPFEEMVDRQLTSYYQERLRWLSPQQREIIQFLCRARGAVPVRHIAEGLFTTHNSITGQLKQLREMRYVDSSPLGREVYYELAEPLMRLALQVKETHDRRPLALIVDFLRIWHEQKEIEERLANCPQDSLAKLYLETAHRLLLTEPNLRHELFRRDLDTADTDADDLSLAKARSLAEESGLAADRNRLGMVLMRRQEWNEAIEVLGTVIADTVTTSEEIAMARSNRGFCYAESGHQNESIADFSVVIEMPDSPVNALAYSLLLRGIVYDRLGKAEKALADLTRCIEMPDAPTDMIAWALNRRGACHFEAGSPEAALADFTRAIGMAGASAKQIAWSLILRLLIRSLGQNHGDVLADLASLLSLEDSEDVRSVVSPRIHMLTHALVESAFASTTDAKRWTALLTEFAGHFARFDGLVQLGEAAVKHLPELAKSPLNHAAWDAWVDAWETAAGSLTEKERAPLIIPLRLLRAGVAWLQTKDDVYLLSLPSEERRVLRESLRLAQDRDHR